MKEPVVLAVEKDIPIPEASHRKRRYPLDQMEVGDSFLVPTDPAMTFRKLQAKASSSVAYAHGTLGGRRFVTRQVEGGVRVWRIA